MKTETIRMTLPQWANVLDQLLGLGGELQDGEEAIVTHPSYETKVYAKCISYSPLLVDVTAPIGMIVAKYSVKTS